MVEDAQQGPLGLGENFLKYSILEIVGRGEHACVYAARDEFFDREVAIKILHRPGGVTADMLRRGRTEAQLLSRLRHPNVVEVVDAGVTNDGQLYIVMELLRGRTLREILRARGKLSTAEALGLFIAVTGGVQAAHDLGAIHRDLKPENLFVLENGTPKVLDFGIAKIVDFAGWSTEKDSVHGDVLYTSPEQLEGARATARSDVYAIGLMLYEALLGKHPCLLSNPAPGAAELTRLQRIKQPPLLSELTEAVPHHVARAVARAIAKTPEARIASMIELREALTTCLERLRREGDARAELDAKGSPKGTWDPADGRERGQTAPPVTTHAYTEWNQTAQVTLEGRRRAFRQVVGAGAIVGTLLGVVALFLLLRRPASMPYAAATVASESSPSVRDASTQRVPAIAAPSQSGAAELARDLPPIAPQTPPSVIAPSSSVDAGATPARRQLSPTKHANGKKRNRAAVPPEREVWIE